MKIGSLEIELLANVARLARDMDQARQTVDRTMGGIERAAEMAKKALGAVGVGLSLIGAQKFFSSILDEQEKLQRNLLRTEALLKSNGYAAGLSAQALRKNAQELALATLQSVEGVEEAQQILLTFTNITGNTFLRATELAADLATVTGTGLSGSMTMLGKALNDPIAGITAMTRAGVSFTEQQKNTIKSLVETGKLLDAQTLILDELARQYGGVAKAEATGFAGAMDTLGQRIQEAKIALADYLGLSDNGATVINLLAEKINKLTGSISAIGSAVSTSAKIVAAYFAIFKVGPAIIAALVAAKAFLARQIAAVTLSATLGGPAIGGMNTMLFGTSVAANIASGALSKLALAGNVLFAAFAGWQLGSLLRENFAEARVAGLTFVGVMLKGWEHLKFGAKLAGAAIASLIPGTESFADAKARLSKEHATEIDLIDKNIAEMVAFELAVKNVTAAESAAVAPKTASIELTDAQKKEFEAAVKSAEKYIESLRTEKEEIGKTADQLYMMRAAREAMKAPLESQREAIMKEALAVVENRRAWEEYTAAFPDVTEATKAATDARLKYLQTMESGIEKMKADVQAQKEYNERIGLSKRAISELDAAKLQEQATILEGLAIKELDKNLDEAKYELYKAQAQELRNLAKLKQEGAAKEAFVEEAEKAASAWKKTTEDIERSLTDALLRGFESGKGFGKNLIDTLKNTFSTLVLRPIVQAIVKPVAGSMAGVLPASGMGGGGFMDMITGAGSGGGGIMNLISAGKSMWEGFSGGMSAGLGSLVSMAGNMLGSSAASAFGAGMGMTSAQAAQAAAAYNAAGMGSVANSIGYGQMAGSVAGLAGGIGAGVSFGRMIGGGHSLGSGSGNSTINAGTALGAVFGGPLGAAIGGVIGGAVNRLFGRKPKEVTSFGVEGDFGADGFAGQRFSNWVRKGGLLRSDKHGTDTSPIDREMIDLWSTSMAAMKASTSEFARTLGLSADTVGTYTKHVRLMLSKDEAENQKRIAELFDGIGNELAGLVGNLSAFAKNGESASGTLQRLSGSITTANSWLSMLRQRLFQVSLAGGNAASKLADAFGGLENLTQASANFYQLYYTEGERAERALNDIRDALAGVNLLMPQTKDELRAMAASLDLNTESGRQAYAVLLSLAPEFANATAMAAQFAKETASKLVSTFSGNGALVPVLNAAALSVQGLEESVNATSTAVGYISRLFLDVDSGLIAFNATASATAPLMTDAQRANLLLNDQIDALRMRAGQATIDIKGLGVALNEFNTETFVAAMTLVFENLADRIRDTIGKIGDERIALREAAQQIINPTVMSKEAIQSGIAGINTRLPSRGDMEWTQYLLSTATNSLDSTRQVNQPFIDNNEYTLRFYTQLKPQLEADLQRTGDAFYQNQIAIADKWIAYAQQNLTTLYGGIAAAEASKTKAEEAAKKAQLEYAAALQDFAINAGASVSRLSRLREETLKYHEAQKQLATLMSNSAKSLRGTVADFKFNQLTPQQQFEQLQTQFATAYAMALSTEGETLAGYGDKLNSLLNPLLEKAREVYGSGTTFNSFSATTIARAEAIASRLESLTPTNYAADSLVLLGQIDTALVALEDASRSAEKLIVDAINAGRDQTVGGLRAVVAALTGQSVPAFAAGGYHTGGLRLVGEYGPELEATGPARIFNAAQTRSLLSGGGANTERLEALVERLTQEVANLRIEARATASHTSRTARQLERFEIDGLTVKTDADTPLQTEAV